MKTDNEKPTTSPLIQSSGSTLLDEAQSKIEAHLEKIERILGPRYKLTLIAKYQGEDLKDADLMLTMNSKKDIDSVMDRFFPSNQSILNT